jgi:hypothetical protein
MIEELERAPSEIIADRVKRTSKQDRFAYVKDKSKYEQYFKNTSREQNYAGSSEAISLSRLFGRKIQMFGQDLASSSGLRLDSREKVLPYLEYDGEEPFIYVFQCLGTGHYRLLTRTESSHS